MRRDPLRAARNLIRQAIEGLRVKSETATDLERLELREAAHQLDDADAVLARVARERMALGA
jgi:hypothetical protein